ncbi:alpha-2-macroglobulin family protein [bacterium]|nr:alpha-2-macroglobulin family protein [bacterium]
MKAPEKPERPSLYGQAKPDLSNPASWDLGQVVSEESITTDANGSGQAKFSLKPGAYRVIGKTSDRFGKELQSPLELIVFEPTSKQFPVKVPNMFLTQSDSVEVGDTFRAIWGTGYSKGRAYIEIEHRNNLLKAYWTNEGKTQALIEIPVSEDMRGGFTVHVTQVRENRAFLESRHVNVPWSNKDLSLSFSHFTSKMQPAQKETWMIKIKGPGAEMKAVEMAATLYDASLDAYAPHSWLAKFGFFRTDYSTAWKHFANRARPLENIYYDWNEGWGAQSRIYYQFPHEININFGGYGYYTESEEGLGGMGVERKAEGRGAPMPAMSPSMQMADSMVSEKESNKSAKREKLSYADEAPGAAHPPSESRGDAAQEPTPDLSKVSARTNLNETAFFFPHLAVEGDGAVNMTFTMPEALTTWKFLGFTHGLNCESGGLLGETITQKDFMVQPNPPRFLREGDELVFTAKVTNLSESRQKGKIRLSLRDATNDNSRDSAFGLSAPDLDFDVPPKESRSVGWKLIVPDGPGIIAYKVVAASGKLSDGEEAMLPMLSRRIFVTESLPLPIRGPATKGFKFQKLLDSSKSSTLVTQSLTVQVTSNPAWYAVQALPYLMEFPHECSEQLFNRFYANSLARFISNSDPRIRKVFDAWKADEALGGKALLSNLEKNEQLKSVLLLETPWVRQAKSETQAKHNVGVLFDSNRLEDELGRATKKLGAMQLSDGSWPWFPGGRGDSFITLYITTGFGRLRHLGVDVDVSMAIRAINHLDSWINEVYQEILRHGFRDRNNLSSTIAIYLYGRGFFLKEKPIPSSSKEAVDYFLGQGSQYWLKLDSRLSQGHLALGLQRFGDNATPKKIGASMKERSVTDEELGRFWRDTELSWWWYRAPIETQAVMIEVFDEVMHDEESVEDCKVWLLKQKQTQDWKTTKATADAIYALLLKGAKLLASEKLVKISLAGNEVKPEKIEAGTGFYEKRFAGNEVKPQMGEISMTKEDKGVAWGGVHWQYLEDMSKVTPHETNLKLKKTLFVKKDSSKGPVISPLANNKLSVGDLLVVRIELRTDRDMEYVHMKDQRGSGLEPTDVLSCYKYQDGLAYYQSTKDTASHFYIDYLPKGVYVFEYNLRVQHKGRYQTGMAEIQCMYAPEFGSHSESFLLEIAE